MPNLNIQDSINQKLYKSLIRPILFQIPPDLIHDIAISTGNILSSSAISRAALRFLYNYENTKLQTTEFNIQFKNPIGLAGGFDKNCSLIRLMPQIGFGFTEVGSITYHPYPGNPKPWNTRLVKDQALIVNYGLKNEGALVLKERIKAQKRFCPLIINIAKTNNPEIKGEESINDYLASFKELQDLADIININISCPNSGDGFLFCENPELLERLLKKLSLLEPKKPIVLKLKPDISDDNLYKITSISKKHPFIKGFVLTNLTSKRNRLKTQNIQRLKGSISGKPSQKPSNEMIKKVYAELRDKKAIIGCGGIFTPEDAYEKILLGSSLLQLITGMIYNGPSIAKDINKGLVKLLEKDNFNNIQEAVGYKIK